MLKKWLLIGLMINAITSLYAMDPPPDCDYCKPACWSNTNPEINLSHVLPGELNSSNKPVGFHSALGLECPDRNLKVIDPPDSFGVYTAEATIFGKTKFSSIFPNKFTKDDIVKAILEAFRNSDKGQSWQGKTSTGMIIHGYLDTNGNINTAFPVYSQDESLRL